MKTILKIFMQNWLVYFFVLAVFFLGAGLGAFTVNNFSPQQQGEIRNYLNAFWEQVGRFQPDPSLAFRPVLYENTAVIGAMYFLGLTFVGIPFILGLVLARGFLFGFAFWCLVKTLSWPGLILALVSLLPSNLVYLPALATGAVAALSFASLTMKRHEGRGVRLWGSFAGYTAVMLVVLSVALGAGLIEVFLSPWLARTAAKVMQMSLSG